MQDAIVHAIFGILGAGFVDGAFREVAPPAFHARRLSPAPRPSRLQHRAGEAPDPVPRL